MMPIHAWVLCALVSCKLSEHAHSVFSHYEELFEMHQQISKVRSLNGIRLVTKPEQFWALRMAGSI